MMGRRREMSISRDKIVVLKLPTQFLERKFGGVHGESFFCVSEL
jgi:hypothetical protein